MDIKRALPRPQYRSVVRSFEERRIELGSTLLTWPVAARPHQILNIHLAQPYRVSVDGGLASDTSDVCLVGPQTYRRAQVSLSGSIHVFNILFQPAGLNRLVGINMTSLVDQDPAASDVLGDAATRLGDAVRMAPDFGLRIAAVERWVGTMLEESGPDDTIGIASRRMISVGGNARIDDPRWKIEPRRQSVSTSLRDTGRNDAKALRADNPLRPCSGRSSEQAGQVLDRHHPRTRLFRSGPLHPRMSRFCRIAPRCPRRRLGQRFFAGRMTEIYKRL